MIFMSARNVWDFLKLNFSHAYAVYSFYDVTCTLQKMTSVLHFVLQNMVQYCELRSYKSMIDTEKRKTVIKT